MLGRIDTATGLRTFRRRLHGCCGKLADALRSETTL
jgi:hypothetical protein